MSEYSGDTSREGGAAPVIACCCSCRGAGGAPQQQQRRRSGDVDRRWAWVVLVSCLLNNVTTAGITLTVGIYYVAFLDVLPAGTHNAHVAWAGALQSGFMYALGPLSSAFIARFGNRVAVMTGGVLMSTGYLLAAFSTSVLHVVLTYGALVGVGSSLAFLACFVVLDRYFERYLQSVIALVVCGAGLGFTIFPTLTQLLLDSYGLRGALIWFSAITLHFLVLGALLYPVPDRARRYCTTTWEKIPELITSKPPGVAETEMKSYPASVDATSISVEPPVQKQVEDLEPAAAAFKTRKWRLRLSKMRRFLRSRGVAVYGRFMEEVADYGNPDFMKAFPMYLCMIISSAIFFSYNVKYTVNAGVSRENAAILVSVFGMSNVTGRFLTAVPVTRRLSTILQFGVSVVFCTLFCALFTFGTSFIMFAVFAAAFGVAYGVQAVMWTLSAREVLGPDKMSKVFGYSSLACGLGFFIGPPLAGWLCDLTRELSVAFYTATVFYAISSGSAFWLYWSQRRGGRLLHQLQAKAQRQRVYRLQTIDGATPGQTPCVR